jgi:hypothetical protein
MIRKMTIKKWISAGVIILFCAVAGGIMLSKYGAAALQGLRGYTPMLARTQSMDNIYFGAGLGLFFAVIGVIIVIRQLRLGVGKQVRRYLADHPEVSMEELDRDFDAAEKYGSIWIGERWTFSYDIVGILVENEKIAWVFSEVDGGRHARYFLCLGLVDGKIVKTSVESDQLVQMKKRYAHYPHILLDNRVEYEPVFNNNLSAFLDIKYNHNIK